MSVFQKSTLLILSFAALKGFSQDRAGEMFSMSFEELMNLQVTTGTKYETSVRETHSTMYVVSGSEIATYGVQTLGELLNLLPGFYISNDRNYIYTGVQGFSRPTDYNNRFLLMIDGHILNENVYGSVLMENGFGLDLRHIERVEVITGPGAALYGNGAMMAVVHIITTGGETKENHVRLSAGSHQTYGSSFSLSNDRGKSSWFATGNAVKSAGEDLHFEELAGQGNNGFARNLDDEKAWAGYLRYNYGDLGLKFLGSHRMKGIPTGSWETDLTERSQSIDERAFAELSYRKNFSRQTVNLTGSWDLYRYRGKYGYTDVDYHDKSIGSWGNLQMDYQVDLNSKSRLIAGAEWHQHVRSDFRETEDGLDLFYRNNRFHNASAFIQYDYFVNSKLSMLGGLRLDDYSYTDASVSPRFSAIYTPNDDLNVRLSFNKAFRAPNFYEKFYESAEENISNPALTNERIYYGNLDIWGKITGKLHGGISLFRYTMDQLIDPVVTTGELVQFVNTGDAKGTGINTIAEIDLTPGVHFQASYTLQKMTIDDPKGGRIKASNYPTHMLKGRLSARIPGLATLAMQSWWESSRKRLDGGNTSSYLMSAVNLRSVRLLEHINLDLKINNIFDKTYYHPAGLEHTMSQIVQPGRSYLFSVEVSL
jgi:iron complex outermembrane receptor protein